MIQYAYSMSLRDHLAAMAMQGMVTAEYAERMTEKMWATDAYRIADAMLAARLEPSMEETPHE
jgi:hypothetical protein